MERVGNRAAENARKGIDRKSQNRRQNKECVVAKRKVVEERLQNASKAYDAAKRAEAAKVCNPDVPRSATGTWDLKAKLDRKSKTQVTFPSLFKT